MTSKSTAAKSKSAAKTAPLEGLSAALHKVIASEVKTACAGNSGGGGGTVDVEAIVTEVVNSDLFAERVNECLDKGLRNVLPQLINRLKDQSSGSSISAVLNSNEMKEMLEDQFRTMLQYLKQDVIPKEIAKGTVGA